MIHKISNLTQPTDSRLMKAGLHFEKREIEQGRRTKVV